MCAQDFLIIFLDEALSHFSLFREEKYRLEEMFLDLLYALSFPNESILYLSSAYSYKFIMGILAYKMRQ